MKNLRRALAALVILFSSWSGFSSPSFASWDLQHLSSLEGDLAGVDIFRLVGDDSPVEATLIAKICPIYVKQFKETYQSFQRSLQGSTPGLSDSGGGSGGDADLQTQIHEDCVDDLRDIHLPDYYFFVAQDHHTQNVLGLAVFEILSPGRVYLATWFATPYQQKRGVGSGVLAPIFSHYPQISSLELIVAEENRAAIEIYEKWGFRPDSLVEGETAVQVKNQGMSLKDDAFLKFARKFAK